MTQDFGRALDSILDRFGQPAGYTAPAGGAPVPLVVRFNETHQVVQTGEDGVPFSTVMPAALVRVADLPGGPVAGGVLEIAERQFEIWDVQPTGNGGALLPLMEITP